MVQGAVHAVIMQNRVRHLEEKVHNGEIPARETLLSDPDTMACMKEAARCADTGVLYLAIEHNDDNKRAVQPLYLEQVQFGRTGCPPNQACLLRWSLVAPPSR